MAVVGDSLGDLVVEEQVEEHEVELVDSNKY